MGGAVSGAMGAVGNSVSDPIGTISNPGQFLSNVSNGVTGGAGSDMANLINNIIPNVPIADQSALQGQIAASSGMAGRNFDYSRDEQIKADQAGVNVNQDLSNGQNAINQAQNVNQGGNVQNALGLLQSQANGTAPSAAEAQLQSGKDQAIASQHALANSGNLSQQISGQKTAMDNAANLTQQAANQATQLRANQQQVGQQNYAQAAGQQASQAGVNAGLTQNQTAQQLQQQNQYLNAAQGYAGQANTSQNNAMAGQTNALGIQQQALGQTAQYRAQALGGLMNAGGGVATALSDANSKTNIQPVEEDRDPFLRQDGPVKPVNSHDDDDQPSSDKTAHSIESSFQRENDTTLSDKNQKKDIGHKDMLSAFLNKIDPVSFKYKDPSGEMGKTPGTHIGVIAQQVEKAPGGESMIVETPEGKGIDLASAVGTLLAAAAQSHQRIEDLEDLFKSKHESKKEKK